MISEKSFIIQINGVKSNKTYKINNGLQQGTVTSPMLFLIFINEMLDLINNQRKNNYSIAFADDIIIYNSNQNLKFIKNDLQNLFNLVQNYIKSWKLVINYNKCELILFRNVLNKCHNSVRKNWKSFHISGENNNIFQKKCVKYLGININPNLT